MNLNAADHAYYSGLPPLMDDATYDRLARATGHRTFTTSGLPGLCNARSPDDLMDWVEGLPADGRQFHVELKIDGVSVLVEYEHGQPVNARGRKLSIPVECLDLPPRFDGFTGCARGEAWHPRGRGFAAGRLRAKDASAGVRWMPFCGNAGEREPWPTQILNPLSLTTVSVLKILDLWDDWRRQAIAPGIPSDGIVVTVADPEIRRRLGVNGRGPRYALALK